MDVIDEKLIFALRENARASTAQLARLVGRSAYQRAEPHRAP